MLTIDSVFYSPTWGGQAGKSLERIDVEQPSIDSKNWETSMDSLGSTPGRPNSIVRLTYDLSIGACYQTRAETESGLRPVINCSAHNAGKKEAQTYSLELYVDSNRDGAFQSDDLITTLNASSPLYPSASSLYIYCWQSAPQGESVVFAVIDFPQDQRLSNNRASTVIRTSYYSRCVVVNEIMYDPLANQNEWVELYNRSNNVVDLRNWKFNDRPTASGNVNTFIITSTPCFLQLHEYVTIAADSTIYSLYPYLANSTSAFRIIILNQPGGLSLSNDGDDIVMKDLTDVTIDSVSYSPAWHRPDATDTKGRSLERINPDLDSNSPYNWTTSVVQSGGTPGRPNSSLTVGAQNNASLSFSPNPFSPDGDGFEDFCLVQYRLPFAAALIHVKIFDIKGRLVRILANSQISTSHGELLWDGLNQDRQRVRIGPISFSFGLLILMETGQQR